MRSEIETHPGLDTALKALGPLKLDSFELYLTKTSRTQIDARDAKIETLTRAEDVGLAIRVLRDQRMGFSFTTSLEAPAITRAITTAGEMAKAMPKDPNNELGLFGETKYPEILSRDDRGLKTPIEEKVARALSLEALCRKQDARVTAVRSASIGEAFSQMCLVDSKGARISWEETLYSAQITCKAEQDGDSQMGGDYGFSHRLDGLNLETVAKMGAETAVELLGAKAAPTLQCPAILRNNVVAELLDFLSASFSAEQIDKGRSLLQGKLGQTLFPPRFTLIDDGLLPEGYATGPFDAEGVPSQKHTLVRNGVFETALYNRYYARKEGCKPSGVSSRGIKSPPSIGFTNLCLAKGDQTLEQLTSTLSKGIVLTDLMGLHTANPITGDFSLGASGFLIEKGRVTHPIKGFAVAGNLLQLLKRITDIGSDHRFFGSVLAPSVLVSEISVGGS